MTQIRVAQKRIPAGHQTEIGAEGQRWYPFVFLFYITWHSMHPFLSLSASQYTRERLLQTRHPRHKALTRNAQRDHNPNP